MRNRILPIINVLLVLVCAGCVWYLSTATYNRPNEIAEAEKYLKGITPTPTPPPPTTGQGTDTTFNTQVTAVATSTPIPPPPGTPMPMMDKEAFKPIWTATPTPTPSPTPTPAPPDLRSAVEAWEITSIDGNNVEFVDRRSPNASESFVMTLNGPPKETIDSQNRPISVSVIAIDTENNKVKLGYMDQVFEKAMF